MMRRAAVARVAPIAHARTARAVAFSDHALMKRLEDLGFNWRLTCSTRLSSLVLSRTMNCRWGSAGMLPGPGTAAVQRDERSRRRRLPYSAESSSSSSREKTFSDAVAFKAVACC